MKISVVIPCYNSENTVLQCLESVENQSFTPYEVLIIDDGSKDGTESIISKWKLSSELNVRYLKQKNSGPSVARNYGIKVAQGDWIAFLDSDDYWEGDKLEKQVSFLSENNDYILVGCGNVTVGNFLEITFKKLLFRNYFQTSSVIVKKEVLQSLMFNEKQKYSEDYLCWLQICLKYKACIIHPRKAYPINKTLAYGGNGLSSRLFDMEKWELKNYLFIYKSGHISFLMFIKISVYSILKFVKRLLVKKR